MGLDLSGLDMLVKSLDTDPNSSSLVRFPDSAKAPELRYDIGLPSSFNGRCFIEAEISLPWNDGAKDFETKGKITPKPDGKKFAYSKDSSRFISNMKISGNNAIFHSKARIAGDEHVKAVQENLKMHPPLVISLDDWDDNHTLHVFESWSGNIDSVLVRRPTSKEEANPRFVIIEKYRLYSLSGDYGAGKTIKTFSLLPGEETKLYVRSWRRTERKLKEGSSIFDSWTSEAADDFSKSIKEESSYKESFDETEKWNAKASFGVNFGAVSFGGGGGGSGSYHSARENTAKTVSHVATHHASKTSTKRETEITSEIETSEVSEFENITERHVKNINKSRVLNLVCRELNQEFTTYLCLVDVSVAVVNDGDLYDEVPIYDIERLCKKYLQDDWGEIIKPSDANDRHPIQYMKERLIREIRHVYDYAGKKHEFLEETSSDVGESYWRVKRRSNPDDDHPFYSGSDFPDGIIMSIVKNVLKTDGVIIDSLLGKGIALDKYALGTQEQALLSRQIENRKWEYILDLIDNEKFEPSKKAELAEKLLVCCPRHSGEKPDQIADDERQSSISIQK